MEYFNEHNYETQNEDIINNDTTSPTEEFSNATRSEDNENSNHSAKPLPNVFAFFSRSLGFFSVFCSLFGIFMGSFICGSLAIILAVLSKGYDTKMEKNAVMGMIAGIVGIVLQIAALLFSIYSVIHVPEFREQFNSLYEEMYGEPMDDSINEMLDDLGIPSTEGGLNNS